ncbi:Hypothetical protein NTJ_04326 [Nesidiocoris tenuis]|uniref:Secreted protein n=1 Tax=Nesidiocoris tenuis TaxID=355587 RepID=A0ABN7AHJ5_9HEMI|nr:Hypothetical protein NTJ_04326 [Nesidiocoris tenuis]
MRRSLAAVLVHLTRPRPGAPASAYSLSFSLSPYERPRRNGSVRISISLVARSSWYHINKVITEKRRSSTGDASLSEERLKRTHGYV